MKFEFELDATDTENLWRVLRRDQMHCVERLIEHKQAGNESDVAWFIKHIRYLDELIAVVFSREVEYTDLSHYTQEH
jgi:hypothetical protein